MIKWIVILMKREKMPHTSFLTFWFMKQSLRTVWFVQNSCVGKHLGRGHYWTLMLRGFILVNSSSFVTFVPRGSILSVKKKAMSNMLILLRHFLIALNVIRSSNLEETLSSISKQFISSSKLSIASFVTKDFPRTATCTLIWRKNIPKSGRSKMSFL